jgi:hypothetical protein
MTCSGRTPPKPESADDGRDAGACAGDCRRGGRSSPVRSYDSGRQAAHRQFVLFVSPQTRLREGVSRGLLRVQRAPGLLNRRSAESVECLLWPARDRLENREDDVGDVTVRLKCLAV